MYLRIALTVLIAARPPLRIHVNENSEMFKTHDFHSQDTFLIFFGILQ